MMTLQGAYSAPSRRRFPSCSPTGVRYSGASLSLQLGTILGGGLAPFVATALFGVTGSSQLVTAYMATVSLISSLCVLGLKETYRQNLSSALR